MKEIWMQSLALAAFIVLGTITFVIRFFEKEKPLLIRIKKSYRRNK